MENSTDLIDDFISRYSREFAYFDTLARQCAEKCKYILKQEGIDAHVTHRAKDPGSLREKIKDRAQTKVYSTETDIRNDITDLAGVRISLLYFDDFAEMQRLLENVFTVRKIKKHQARIITTNLLVEPLTSTDITTVVNKNDLVEIQITSVLLGAWADIQRGIEYKPRVSATAKNILTKKLDLLRTQVLDSERLVSGIYGMYRQRAILPRTSFTDVDLNKVPYNVMICSESTNRQLYWYATDGRRYVFPNEETLHTWFPETPKIYRLHNDQLIQIKIGGNVTYKPGIRLVKISTDLKIYAVEKGGVLRWIENEKLCAEIYGDDWHDLVDEVPDEYFVNYQIGTSIAASADYDPRRQQESVSYTDIGYYTPPCTFTDTPLPAETQT
ncbi:MAG: RelA/SpoT domain-containing protein [Patescibacteria group bacterium]|jgi:ppGpp synthetase/RelA/SpoT-type nucleotidyltranferase